MDSQENFQGFYRVENCFALHLSVFIPFYIRRRRMFHPKSFAKQMNVLRMICRWTGVCHVPDSTTRATWTTCWRWKLIYYTSGVLLTIIVRKKNILELCLFRERKNGRSVVDMWQMVKRKYIAVDMIPSRVCQKRCVHWSWLVSKKVVLITVLYPLLLLLVRRNFFKRNLDKYVIWR